MKHKSCPWRQHYPPRPQPCSSLPLGGRLMHLVAGPKDNSLKFLENKAGCTEEVTGTWRKSHCYYPAPCQPGTLSLHSTSDAPRETGNSHSRLSWRSQDQWPEVSKEPLEHSAPQGQLEPSDRRGSVYFLQRCLLLALSGTKASPSTSDESSLTPCSVTAKAKQPTHQRS